MGHVKLHLTATVDGDAFCTKLLEVARRNECDDEAEIGTALVLRERPQGDDLCAEERKPRYLVCDYEQLYEAVNDHLWGMGVTAPTPTLSGPPRRSWSAALPCAAATLPTRRTRGRCSKACPGCARPASWRRCRRS